VTDGEGRYILSDLSPGSYTISFRLPGFRTLTRNFVAVSPSLPTSLDVVLGVSPSAGTFREFPPFRFRPLPPVAQRRSDPRPYCLHGQNETAAEQERRLEALAAVRLMYGVLDRVPATARGYPDWETLARSKVVADLKNAGGAVGELANKTQWGSREPLPGWSLRYQVGLASVAFALADLRDPCGFTISSNDPDVVPPNGRIVPLIPG
jgi:hypothetical protein